MKGNNMTLLWLDHLCIKEAEELAVEDKRLFDALLNSSLSQLQELILADNPLWFKDDEAR